MDFKHIDLGDVAAILGAIFLIRYVIDTYRISKANTYFKIMQEINGPKNIYQISKLNNEFQIECKVNKLLIEETNKIIKLNFNISTCTDCCNSVQNIKKKICNIFLV